ncbi:MAG: aspartate carbamoyltransferase [Candidatus Wildermuthbacteria bacterium]|nr:aspartate carbamoyltransferase [Candidatus Wildermuthbacteria bacterium]
MKHVLESQQFDSKTIQKIFAIANALGRDRSLPFKGKIMATLFYEPSTRTRFSFESAMIKLGGNVISTENAGAFSSAAKGETLEDTIRVVSQYADVIVLRHYEKGVSERAAAVSSVPIINAGDGTGQHPTQALLDLYTIKKELGKTEGIRIAFVGDLKNGRTARSLAYLLGKYKHSQMFFISPAQLRIGEDIKAYLDHHAILYQELRSWDSVLGSIDVLYQTRIQKERFKTMREYNKYEGRYVIGLQEAKAMKKNAIIMHPLPRIDEISPEVDALPQAVYFKQAKYGLLVRMALLKFLLS